MDCFFSMPRGKLSHRAMDVAGGKMNKHAGLG